MLKYLAGPLIGAVIGYCTNYLAVKMLFYPRKEIKLGGHTLPFTPGAIPKGKPRLAKAIGNIVAERLLTEEDITKQLTSQDTEEAATDAVMKMLQQDIRQEVCHIAGSEEACEQVQEKLGKMLTQQILDSVHNIEVGKIVAEQGGRIIKEKTAGTMLQMFVTDDLVASITGPVGEEIERYIDENGESLIEPEINRKLSALGDHSIADLAGQMGVDETHIRETVSGLYRRIITESAGKVIKQFNVSGMIEEKINEMNVDELENLVLTVMKKELDTIVNLGALIGLLLGIINIFF